MERLVESGVGPEFLRSEANGYRSRKNIVIGASQALLAGAVLAVINAGLTAAAAAVAGNTGEATITAAPDVAAGARRGRYTLTAVSAGATAEFLMAGPDGQILGNVTTGTPATLGGIGPFTITDAGADPAIGDQFVIDVTADEALDRYVMHDPEGTDGSQFAAGILYDAVTTGAGETAEAVGVVRDAEFFADRLAWGDHSDAEKAAALAQLAALGLIAR